MEEALQLPLTEQPIKRNNYLVAGIATSLLLHAACTVFLLAMPSGSHGNRSITYIDLTLPQGASPAMTAPAARPAVKTPAVLQTPQPVEKALPVPEAQPAPAEQAKSAPAPAANTTEQPVAGTPEQPVASTFGLGLSRGFFRSIHDGETLRTDVKEYYMAMLDGINNKWWMDKQFDKVRIEPIEVWITIARSGQVLNAQLTRSSGNPRYDKMVLAALSTAGPLPPLPATYEDETFQAPLRLSPPLNLLGF
ncbi:TonB family protein [Geomonas sp.]|uniref:TonB family protein n=1 Tax=Geomonas sp. TaxID=2651584 RepID=UPI002B4A17EC|nr:TonB family protein [Geomonas sp.]HJV36801.1 TonB family protein [Geomonas sp.]